MDTACSDLQGSIALAFAQNDAGPEGRLALKTLVTTLVEPVRRAIAASLYRYRSGFRHHGGYPEVEQFVGLMFERLLDKRGEALRKWDATRPIEPYLGVIARNVVLDELRRLGARGGTKSRLDVVEPGEVEQIEVEQDLDKQIESRDELNRIIEAVYQSAPEREIQVFELRFVRELPVRDVATILGLSENGVSQAIRRLQARILAIAGEMSRDRKKAKLTSASVTEPEGDSE